MREEWQRYGMRERSLQQCQYAEWEGKRTNADRSKKTNAVRRKRRTEQGREGKRGLTTQMG